MNNTNYQIKSISKEELKIPVSWAAKEGWNPGLYDIDAFYATDPKGFFMGLLDDKPIASLTAVSYDDKFGFLGFYIVKPEYRNKGYGYKLWQEALKHLSTQNIGLDGVVAQQENYKKSGFKLAYRNIRFEGIANGNNSYDKNAINLSKIPFNELLVYDNKLFPSSRPAFLKEWIKQPESKALGILKDNKLVGYGVIRKCGKGYKIGPLFADNKEIAGKLFLSLTSHLKKGDLFYLDIPEVNKEAVKLTKENKMKYVFETARMYTKKPPKLPMNKIFGVTTFELG